MSKTKTPQKAWLLRRTRRRVYNTLPLRKRYLIVTNGVTEAVYFENYHGPTGPSIKVVLRPKDPCRLVEKAIAERAARIRRGESIQETWVVFDRDVDVDRNGDYELFCRALQMAKENGIEIGYSDDSFELWYVLHYQEVTTALPRAELIRLIERHRGQKYEKGAKGNLYSEILPNRSLAIKRAHKLLKKLNAGQPTINPSTRVHILVERLIANDPRFSANS